MMNMMGNQMLGNINAAMQAQGQPVMMAAPGGQPVNYNYQPGQ